MHSSKVIPLSENSNTPGLKPQENSAPPDTWQHISAPVERIVAQNTGRKFQRRDYSEEELALFAAYLPYRAYHRPKECREDIARCWVRQGPPAYDGRGGHSRCAGCGGHVGSRPRR